MLPPLHILEKYTVSAGGVASKTFTIGTLVTDWDAAVGVTSRHLCILVYAASGDAVDNRNIQLQFNGDTGNNYNDMMIYGLDAAPNAAIATGAAVIRAPSIPGTNYADAFGGGFILIPHAFNTIGHKDTLGLFGAAEYNVFTTTGRWANTAAITSIRVFAYGGDFIEGSVLYLCVVDERYQIGESILDGADGTFSFPNIENRDGDLVAIGYLRSDRASIADSIKHEINTDTTVANYWTEILYGVETPAIAIASVNNSNIAACSGVNATANVFGAMLAFYPHFAGSLNDSNALVLSGFHESTGPTARIYTLSVHRNNIEPINRIDYKLLGGTNFKDGSMMSIYRSPKNLIARHICNVSEAYVTFDNLDRFSQDFEAIEIRMHARTDRTEIYDGVDVSFNDDETEANYDRQELYGAGASPTAARSAADRTWVSITGDDEGANEFGGGSLLLLNYANNYGHKHGIVITGRTENYIILKSCRWENTDPIRKATLTPSGGTVFLADSVFELYGIVPIDDVIRRTRQLTAEQSLARRKQVWRS